MAGSKRSETGVLLQPTFGYHLTMCNLYSQTRNVEAIRRLFRISHNRAPASIDPLPAIFPGHMAPVVRHADDGERELGMLSWGFVLLQNGRAPRRVTNTRDRKSTRLNSSHSVTSRMPSSA